MVGVGTHAGAAAGRRVAWCMRVTVQHDKGRSDESDRTMQIPGDGRGDAVLSAGAGRRNLHVAVHCQDPGPGGLRLRLDPGRRRHRGRAGQAGHHRHQSRLRDLRPSGRLVVRGRAQRSASLRTERRSQVPVGRRTGHQQDLRVRHPHRPAQARTAPGHHRFRRENRGTGRPAYVLRPAGTHDDHGALEQRRSWRAHGHGRIQQQRRVHRDPLDTDRRGSDGGRQVRQARGRVRLRRAGEGGPQHHADLLVHRLVQLHDGTSERCCRTARPCSASATRWWCGTCTPASR